MYTLAWLNCKQVLLEVLILKNTYIARYMHTYIHIYTYMHTYIHIYMHTYMEANQTFHSGNDILTLYSGQMKLSRKCLICSVFQGTNVAYNQYLKFQFIATSNVHESNYLPERQAEVTITTVSTHLKAFIFSLVKTGSFWNKPLPNQMIIQMLIFIVNIS